MFTEVASGAKKDRPVLKEVMAYLRSNSDDVLTAYKLDRVARSPPYFRFDKNCIANHNKTDSH
ncbi:recombinase family protein [Halocynthiibacter namhaensis]|uniref:recombinase family protein n=1 Tax=Halocynthiibacter namhaensis TaxID=1290553 RepID=UPI00068A0477|nr:recombinase family protein [Halocynthiibacter namhaensis]